MANVKENKSKLKKGRNSFELVGNVKLSENAFNLDEEAKTNKDWISSRLFLGIQVDEGRVNFAQASSGFSGSNPMAIKRFVKTEKGAAPESRPPMFETSWDGRHEVDDKTLASLQDDGVFTVGLETFANGKVFYKKFLTVYDALPYVQEHLKDGMKVKVKGKLVPKEYKGEVKLHKEINAIFIVDEKVPNCAKGVITILFDANAIGKTRFAEADEFDVSARLVDYASKYNEVDVKDNVAFPITLVLPVYSKDTDKNTIAKWTIKTLFEKKPKKVTEAVVNITFEEGNRVNQATLDDLDDDARALVTMGILSEAEAIGKLSVRGNPVNRLVIIRPEVETIENGDKKSFKPLITVDKYEFEDLILPEAVLDAQGGGEAEQSMDEFIKQAAEASAGDDDWLSKI